MDCFTKSFDYVWSIISVGIMYRDGLGVEKNFYKAFELFDLARKFNSHGAYYYIGSMYKNGIYVEKNIKKTIKYFKRGAKLLCKSSMNALVTIYRFDYILKKNPKNYNKVKKYYLQLDSVD